MELSTAVPVSSPSPSTSSSSEDIPANNTVAQAGFLRECARSKDLLLGKRIHSELAASGRDRKTLLGNLLAQMYAKCGELELARAAFERILERNVYSWTIVISAYSKKGNGRQALEFYHRMCLEGIEPDVFALASVLNACCSPGALAEGKAIHARVVASGFEYDMVLQNVVLNMYGKCGSVEDARKMFDGMKEKDVVSWNALIAAYAQDGYNREALHLLQRMNFEGERPDIFTFASVLGVCSSLGALEEGRNIHSQIAGAGIHLDAVLQNALVNMYAKCGSVGEARTTFDGIKQKTVVSWTSMVAAYAQHEYDKEALELYHMMSSRGVKPDAVTFSSIISVCSRLGAIEDGREIHARVVAQGLESTLVVQNALVNFYAKSGCLDDAASIFEAMREKDAVSWNAIITAVSQEGYGWEALMYYRKMNLDGMQPDLFTFSSILGACSCVGALSDGIAVHSRLVDTGFESLGVVESALVNMYVKCKSIDRARSVFVRIRRKDLATWNAMIIAHTDQGHGQQALKLYHEMNLEGVEPNVFTFISLLGACSRMGALAEGKAIHARISACGFDFDPAVGTSVLNMYANCGSLEDARVLFDNLPEKDVFSWTLIIAAYTQKGYNAEALELYQRMDSEGVQPDMVTFATVLSACSGLEDTKAIHTSITESDLDSDVVVATALVNAYAKCGSLEDGRSVFDGLRNKNVLSWTAMIVGYARHARCQEALQLFEEMHLEGVEPDEVTFTSILHACSHAGLLYEGHRYFVSLAEDHGIARTVEHYRCMIDMLGRAGWLAEAEELVSSMPFQHDNLAWMTLLSACKVQGDRERSSNAAQQVFHLDKENAAPYVVLSNVFVPEGENG